MNREVHVPSLLGRLCLGYRAPGWPSSIFPYFRPTAATSALAPAGIYMEHTVPIRPHVCTDVTDATQRAFTPLLSDRRRLRYFTWFHFETVTDRFALIQPDPKLPPALRMLMFASLRV